MENYWKVRVDSPVNRLGVDVYIYRYISNRKMELLKSSGTIVKEAGEVVEPTLSLEHEAFQALVDAIHSDHKPSEGKFVEGKLEATENHLEDLRKLLKLNK